MACAALAGNLLLVFAVMILLNAPLTLPGVAGLALTVGMAVDGNVLIFERVREEMARGHGAAHGDPQRLRSGHDHDRGLEPHHDDYGHRALCDRHGSVARICRHVDAWASWSSMFTAVFCSRVDVRHCRASMGWIKDLRMMRLIGATNLDFIGKCGIAVAGSLVVIVIGLVAMVARGQDDPGYRLHRWCIGHHGAAGFACRRTRSAVASMITSRTPTPPVTCTVNTVGVIGRLENSVYRIDANLDVVCRSGTWRSRKRFATAAARACCCRTRWNIPM